MKSAQGTLNDDDCVAVHPLNPNAAKTQETFEVT